MSNRPFEWQKPHVGVPVIHDLREIASSALAQLVEYLGQIQPEISGTSVLGSTLSSYLDNGTRVSDRRGLNFIAGTNATVTMVDNPTSDVVDVTIAATGGGGGASPLTTKGDIYTHDATVDARKAVGTNNQLLKADSAQATGLAWGTADTANITNDAVTDAKLRNSGALTVVGRAANSIGDPADIVAAAAGNGVLRESGSTLGFAQITDANVAAANKDGVAGTASMRTLGTGAQQAAGGTDARLSDARTPTAHATSHQPGGTDAMAVDAAAATGSLRTLGTGALQATAGNDTRLSDARAPTGAASGDLSGTYPGPSVVDDSHSHVAGTVTEAGLLTADNTTADVTTAKHGFTPKAPNDTTQFLRGDATWAAPAAPTGTLATTEYRIPIEDNRLELAGDSRMLFPGSSRMFFTTPEKFFRLTTPYDVAPTVPHGHFRLHYKELRLTARNRATLQGTSDLVVTDLGGPTNRLVLAGGRS